jgi:hypothetical protein
MKPKYNKDKINIIVWFIIYTDSIICSIINISNSNIFASFLTLICFILSLIQIIQIYKNLK